ncbi:MAG: hypothetical protein EBU88_11585 [Acidobacteria bacterium]|nr:hypothetical protein [Acidobacteriota bacterium]
MFLKCLTGLFVFVFIVYVLKSIARLRFFISGTMGDVRRLRDQLAEQAAKGSAEDVGAEMTRCLACGAFVATGEAVTIRSSQGRQSFCSSECLRRHVK